jgi:hypothetical protein
VEPDREPGGVGALRRPDRMGNAEEAQQMSEEKYGIEKLRTCVAYLDNLDESFNQRFTAGELFQIWRAALAHDDWPEMADTWSEEQIAEALGTGDPAVVLALNALHDIAGALKARELLTRLHLTGPMRESMKAKAMTDGQIQEHALDAWERVAMDQARGGP